MLKLKRKLREMLFERKNVEFLFIGSFEQSFAASSNGELVFLRAENSRCREYRSNGTMVCLEWLLRRPVMATAPCIIIHSPAAWNLPSPRDCCAILSASVLRVCLKKIMLAHERDNNRLIRRLSNASHCDNDYLLRSL